LALQPWALHTPAVQAPLRVHTLPVEQAVPSAATGFEHTPVLVLQVPAVWQPSSAEQTTGFVPTQVPAAHTSVWVQALPSVQVLPVVGEQVPRLPGRLQAWQSVGSLPPQVVLKFLRTREAYACEREARVRAVAAGIADSGSNIVDIKMDDERGIYTGMLFTLQVSNRMHLARVMKALRRIQAVVRISRVRE
jgi:hypothetical protein